MRVAAAALHDGTGTSSLSFEATHTPALRHALVLRIVRSSSIAALRIRNKLLLCFFLPCACSMP